MTRRHGQLMVGLLGLYLACGFLWLYPEAKQILLQRGFFGTHSLSGGAMPNLLAQLPLRWGIQAWVLSAALYSLLLLWRGLWAIVPWLIIYAFLCLADAMILPVNTGFIAINLLLIALAIFAVIDAKRESAYFPFAFPKWAYGPYLIIIGGFVWFNQPMGAVAAAFFFNPLWIPAKRVQKRDDVVVFFDGYCGLCSHAVDFLMEEDALAQLRYSPLQGDAASKLRESGQMPKPTVDGQFDSLIVKVDQQIHQKSDAVLSLAPYLGGLWRVFGAVASIVPSGLRNAVYGLVAKNRYRIFGKRETCRMPTKDERKLFI